MKRLLKSVYQAIPFKKNFFLVVKRFIKLSPQAYQHLHFKGDFKVTIDSQHKFVMRHHGYLVENEIFWGGLYDNAWEASSLKYWTELCKDSSCIIDAGANTGIYSLIAKKINKEATVIAFEPLRGVSTMLQKNIELNDLDVLCVEKALSNTDGEAMIYDDLNSDHSYAATVNVNLRPDNSKVGGAKIKTIRLETFIQEQGIKKIDLMKIDVETHEPELLEGFGKYLKQFEPTMLIEILNDDIAIKVQEMIKTIPYLYYNINEAKGARKVGSLSKSDGYNFLICKKDTALKLGLAV
jgi:FkbM family methyltransferase